MIGRVGVLALGLWICGGVAGFAGHATPLWQIKFGIKLGLYQPEILLVLAASGLAISYWGRRDAVIGFAAFMAGVLLGFPLVFVWQIDMVWLALILTLAFGGTVATHLFFPVRVQQAYLFLAGACCAPLAFIGHFYNETTPLMLAGFVATLLVILALAYLVCAVLNHMSGQVWWLAVVLRVFGAWASAAAIMLAAFFIMTPAA